MYSLDTFWTRLLQVREDRGAAIKYFGIAVRSDLVLDRQRYYFDKLLKAYIRGPKGFSEAKLQSIDFPSDWEGTETEHYRLADSAPISWVSLFDVQASQISWSASVDRNTGAVVKSVEIEELVPLDSSEFKDQNDIYNRYVHAEWDTKVGKFRHFDGALRVYDKADYPLRLQGKVKKAVNIRQDHRKVFRIDGGLDVKTWSNLTALFFAQNELVTEYLGGEEVETNF